MIDGVVFFLYSERITAANINAQPAMSRIVSGSPRKITEKIRPNTDSNDKRIDEVFGVKYFCPTFWRRNPIIVLKIPRYKRLIIMELSITLPSNGPYRTGAIIQLKTAATTICRTVILTGSWSSV